MPREHEIAGVLVPRPARLAVALRPLLADRLRSGPEAQNHPNPLGYPFHASNFFIFLLGFQ